MLRGSPSAASKRLLAELAWIWQRSSWGSRLGVVLVVLNLLVLALAVLPALGQIGQLNQQADAYRKLLASGQLPAELQQPADPLEQLLEFEAGFPVESATPDVLAQINGIVTAFDLRIMEAEYRLMAVQQSRLLAYQINMPLRGKYGNILGASLRMLDQIPNLALNNITFQRKAIADGQAEAILSMTLYLKRT